MAWCRQATSHYLNLCGESDLCHHGVSLGHNVYISSDMNHLCVLDSGNFGRKWCILSRKHAYHSQMVAGPFRAAPLHVLFQCKNYANSSPTFTWVWGYLLPICFPWLHKSDNSLFVELFREDTQQTKIKAPLCWPIYGSLKRIFSRNKVNIKALQQTFSSEIIFT